MWSKLVSVLNSLQRGSLKSWLTGAGLMLGTSVASMTAFSAAVSALKNQTNAVSVDVLALAHLSGFDVAMSLILGAIVTRMTLNSSKLVLRKHGG